ncbi:uncharacterized protein LOC121193970 isoform X1 [Toxotes jaculatrix]|uniref:uncharacterized protein LOC121193970 isoform X1 n=1 Tax=Toxotes jaculatrix TaxID=941984 RepID=UPI001B3A9288|nr:uncharacterized protein LOC121193970 isoform X1 [Toxotes jaculatrix]
MDYVALNQTTPTGYSYVDNPRAEGRGGGIAVIHRDDLTLSPLSIPAASSFEHLAFRLPGPQSLTVAIIYRPPKTTSSFLSDFTDFFTQLSSISSSLLLLGDFNIHIDSPKCKFSADFLDILNCFNLTQHVNSPTHSRGHILDLVCSTACLCIQNLSLTDLAISDHLAITMDINIPIPGSKHTYTITFRNLKSLFPISFSSSISDIITASSFPANPTPPELVVYNRTLSTCLNQLAPLKTKTVSFSHSTQWYTPELHILKKKQRQLDSLCKKIGLTVHSQAHKDHATMYKAALNNACSKFYSDIVHSNSSNPRTLFSTINKPTKPEDNITVTFTTDKCNNFLPFFHSKIDSIHRQLASTHSLSEPELNPSTSHSLSSFSPLSPFDVSKLFSTTKLTTCHLDPIPSSLIKACLPSLIPLITSIINTSLTTGSVPPSLKCAAITPILKKPGLNPDNLENFRPISNLPLLSKILKCSVFTQLQQYLHSYGK